MASTDQEPDATGTLIQPGQSLPRLKLDSPDGPKHLTRSGTQSTLVVYLHPEPCQPCAGYLEELAPVAADLREWATSLVAVVPADQADQADQEGPFPLLHDDAAARRQLGIGQDEAAVLLADRWGEVFEAAAVGADHGFPLPSQLVESAKILDLSCGECNVPGAEWRSSDA